MTKTITALIVDSPHDTSVTLHNTPEDAITCRVETVDDLVLTREDPEDAETYLDDSGEHWIFTVTTTELPD